MNSSTYAVRAAVAARSAIGAAVVVVALASAGCAGSGQYQAGVAHLDAQDYDRAVETLREAVKSRPGNTEYLARLEAAESKSADQHVAAAQEHIRNRRLTDAWREIQIARDRVPTHPEVTKLSEPLKRDIARSDALAAQAEAALAEGRWEEAHRLAGEALAIDAAHDAAGKAERRARDALVSDRIAAARLATQRGDDQAFRAAVEQAYRIDPENAVVQQLRRQAGPATADQAAVATRPVVPAGPGPVAMQPAAARPAEQPAPAPSPKPTAASQVTPGPATADPSPAPAAPPEVKPLPAGRSTKPVRETTSPQPPVQPRAPAPAVVPATPEAVPANPASPLIIGLGEGESEPTADPTAIRPVPRPASRPAGLPPVPSPSVRPAVAPAGPTAARTPAPANAEPGRIVPAPRYGPSEREPQSFLHRAVISRKDKRYRDTATTVDGVRVRLRDTDADPLDADIDIFIGTTRIRRDDVRIGQGVTFRVAAGRTYRLVILSILDDRETISFGIQRVPDAP